MAALHSLSLQDRAFVRLYRWRFVKDVAFEPWTGDLATARVALVSSAGMVLPTQARFDHAVKGGDWSYRHIPGDSEVATLIDTHRSASFDHAGMVADPNLAFPIDRLREFQAAGRIGEVSPVHLSFMGSITAPEHLIRKSAPEAAARLVAAQVDLALLVPV